MQTLTRPEQQLDFNKLYYSAYLLDVYTDKVGASALAGDGLFRYGLSAAFPLTTQILDRLGSGWELSLMGFIALHFCLPLGCCTGGVDC
jgi:hypothetical protein